MNSIGPFKEIVTINFPTDGIAGQYIFECTGNITLFFKNFSGTINGADETILDGSYDFSAGIVEIKGKQVVENEPLQIYAPWDNLPEYTLTVQNWTLFRFYRSPGTLVANGSTAVDYFTGGLGLGTSEVSATANQPNKNWFNLPSRPKQLDGANLDLMFAGSYGCGDLSNLYMPNATSAAGMFAQASGVNWNKILAPALSRTAGMFAGARSMYATDGSPVIYEKMTDASYMFYGCDIRELIGCSFKGQSLVNFLTSSDIEFIDSCKFTDTGEKPRIIRSEILGNAGKLNIVRNSIFELYDAGSVISGTSIYEWSNNSFTHARNQDACYITFKAASVTNSSFYGEFFVVEGLNTTMEYVTVSGGDFYSSPGTVSRNCDFNDVSGQGFLDECSISGFFQDQGFSQITSCVITNAYKNYGNIRLKEFSFNTVTLPQDQIGTVSDEIADDIDLINFTNTALDSSGSSLYSAFVRGCNVEKLGGIAGPGNQNIGHLFWIRGSRENSSRNVGVAEFFDITVESSSLDGFIIQKRDTQLSSVFITNNSPVSEPIPFFFNEGNIESGQNIESIFLYNYEHKVVITNSDLELGFFHVIAKEVETNNSVIGRASFLYHDPSKITQSLVDSLIDCYFFGSYKADLPFVIDLDVSGLYFKDWFTTRPTGGFLATRIENFKPKGWAGRIYNCPELKEIRNSNFNKGSDSHIEIEAEKIDLIAGCIFYKGALIRQLNSAGKATFMNSRFGNTYQKGDPSFGFSVSFNANFLVEWFNVLVEGSFLPRNLACENPSGVVRLHPGSDFKFFRDTNGGSDYSDFIIDLTYFDKQFVMPLDFIEPFSTKDAGIGTVNIPQLVYGDIAPNRVFEQFIGRPDYGLNISKLYEIVSECERTGAYNADPQFFWPYPRLPAQYTSDDEIKNAFRFPLGEPIESERLFIETDHSGSYYVEVYFMSFTTNNIAFCQNRLLTEFDRVNLKNRLDSAGFTAADLGYTYEVKAGKVVEGYSGYGTRAFFPDRIELIKT